MLNAAKNTGDTVCSPETCLVHFKVGWVIYEHKLCKRCARVKRQQRSVVVDSEVELTCTLSTWLGYEAGRPLRLNQGRSQGGGM